MRSTKYSLIHHLKYDYEENGTMSSTCNSSILKNLCQAKQKHILLHHKKYHGDED
jgi:hypothetical protein